MNQIVAAVVDHESLNEPEDVWIDGQYAYIPCRRGGRLSVYDVSRAAEPVFVGSFNDPELTEAMGVATNADIVYLTSWHSRRLLILDGSDRSRMTKVSSIEIGAVDDDPDDPDELRKVCYRDGYAYVTHSHDGTLTIVDVSDPRSPKLTGSVVTGDGAFAVAVQSDTAFVGGCFPGSSLNVIDVSDKTAPRIVKTLAEENYACTGGYAIRDNYLFAVYYSANAFVTFDISDPRNPIQIALLKDPVLNKPNRLCVVADTAYVASAGGNAVVQVDIADPRRQSISSVVADERLKRAYGIACSNGYVFAVGRDADSLVVLGR